MSSSASGGVPLSARQQKKARQAAAAELKAGGSNPSSSQAKGKEKQQDDLNSIPSLGPSVTTAAGGSSTGTEKPRDEEWNWEKITSRGGNKVKTVFSRDGSYFFLPHSNSIKIHSTTSLLPLSTLSGHTLPITSLLIPESNPLQLISTSLDGTMKLWDWIDGVCLKTVTFPGAVTHFTSGGGKGGDYYAAVEETGKKGTEGKLRTFTALYSISSAPQFTIARLTRFKPISHLSVSPSKKYILAIANAKAFISSTKPESLVLPWERFVASSDNLVLGCWNTTQDFFVTGDVKGVIRVWDVIPLLSTSSSVENNKVTNSKTVIVNGSSLPLNKPKDVHNHKVDRHTATQSYHWHSSALTSLCFTPNGSTLLSGGNESVLCSWTLSTPSGKPTFVPRLGGSAITFISVRPASRETENGALREEEIWAGLEDGTVKVIVPDPHTSGKKIKGETFSSIKISPSVANSSNTTVSSSTNEKTPRPILAVHPKTGWIVTPTAHSSSIQFLNPKLSGKPSLEIEIIASNRTSKRDKSDVDPALSYKISHVKFSKNGAVMATSDSVGFEVVQRSLKIWVWDEETSAYRMVVRFNNPHGPEVGLSALCFSNEEGANGEGEGKLLVSTDVTGGVKVWKKTEKKFKSGNIEVSYQPYSNFSYRSLAVTSASLSPDSSILALTQGSVVSLWNPVTSELRGTLTCPEIRQGLKGTDFIGSDGRYLVGHGKRGVVVWDLVKGDVLWCNSTLAITHLVPSTVGTPTFTVFLSPTAQSDTYVGAMVYSATSPLPIKKRAVPFKIRQVVSYVTAHPPLASASTSIYTEITNIAIITDRWELAVVGDDIKDITVAAASTSEGRKLTSTSSKSAGLSLFDEVFGPTAEEAPRSKFLVNELGGALPSLDSLFDAAPQIMPPMSLMFEEVMELLNAKNSGSEVEEEEEQDNSMKIVWQPEKDSGRQEKDEVSVARVVSDADVAEITSLFKSILSNVTSIHPTPAKKVNGTHINGTSSSKSSPSKPINGTPVSGRANKSATPKSHKASTSSPKLNGTPASEGRKRKLAN